MQIWVDADACPGVIKNILFRAAERTHTVMTLVANHPLPAPASPYVKKLQVGGGFDVADNQILKLMQKGDLVITADIPLANGVIENGGTALNPRGTLYTEDNIKQCLSLRDFSEAVRSSGRLIGGPATLSKTDVQQFANQLDRFLSSSV